MTAPRSLIGRQLYALLPAVYRSRDEGDLAAYLDACGELLDRIRNTLDQRLADCFPDPPESGRAVQDWLLPYFAQLLDVRLVSPHSDGRRLEVSNAVAWRQRKGTLTAIEGIAEAVGQLEVEIGEGWRRLAVTPRLEAPLLPATALGRDEEPDETNPLDAARHPGLPAVTPDLRFPSRAVASDEQDPVARAIRFDGEPYYWRQTDPHGAPCFPGSYDDPSRRTVDLRTPGWKHGHFHPRRLLLFAPPPTGFFPLQITLMWSERFRRDHREHFAESHEHGQRRLFNPSWAGGAAADAVAVTFTTRPVNFAEPRLLIENLNFLDTLTVDDGRLELRGVAAAKVVVKTAAAGGPVLVARDCLFGEVEAPDGLVRLEYCTVRESLTCGRVQASDCIFVGEVVVNDAGNGGPAATCIRYSRIPPALEGLPWGQLRRPETTAAEPVFFDFEFCDAAGTVRRSSEFGAAGCGVLHPATPDSIRFGAEDGGEMGAYHQQRYCLQSAAVLDKLEDFLPVGLEAVLVPDPRLLSAPPEQTPDPPNEE